MSDVNYSEAPEVESSDDFYSGPDPYASPSSGGGGGVEGSLSRAFDKVFGGERSAEKSTFDRARTQDGRFAPTQQDISPQSVKEPQDTQAPQEAQKTPYDEPPTRFSPEGKAAWAAAPEAVKTEVHRAVTEMERGIQQYRQQLSEFDSIKEYNDLAKRNGRDLKEVLDQYVGFETALTKDPAAGLEKVFEYIGVDPVAYARHILGQSGADQTAQPEERHSFQENQMIASLRQEIAALKSGYESVQSTIQQQKQAEREKQVMDFASQNPRFDELSETIAQLLQSGYSKDLAEAYRHAELLNPVTGQAPAATPAAKQPDLSAQTRKGRLSVTGAPASGSNPASRNSPPSIEQALKNSFSRVGLI